VTSLIERKLEIVENNHTSRQMMVEQSLNVGVEWICLVSVLFFKGGERFWRKECSWNGDGVDLIE
jgi:hypothetical protein